MKTTVVPPPACCLSCGKQIVPDEVERGWVFSGGSIDAEPKVYFLCYTCRPVVRIEWHPNGTPKAITGPTRRVL